MKLLSSQPLELAALYKTIRRTQNSRIPRDCQNPFQLKIKKQKPLVNWEKERKEEDSLLEVLA